MSSLTNCYSFRGPTRNEGCLFVKLVVLVIVTCFASLELLTFEKTVLKQLKPVQNVQPEIETNVEESEASRSAFDLEQKRRVKHIRRVCHDFRRMHKSSPEQIKMVDKKLSYHSVTVELKHKLAWCRAPKVGTTTWALIFLHMYGLPHFVGHFHPALAKKERSMVPRKERHAAVRSLANSRGSNHSFSGLLTGRHPIDRLFSTYRDKILRHQIRIRGLNTPGSSPLRRPTFAGFLDHVASKPKGNRHWKPVQSICNPCKYNYDYVLKMENFTRDSAALLEKIQVDVKEVKKKNSNDRWYKSSAMVVKNETYYKDLLKDVSAKTLETILKEYYLDFELFEYDIKMFRKMVRERRVSEGNVNETVAVIK